VAQEVECLSSKCKALSSNHTTAKKIFKNQKLKNQNKTKPSQGISKTILLVYTT
jgi:hypothetical protein